MQRKTFDSGTLWLKTLTIVCCQDMESIRFSCQAIILPSHSQLNANFICVTCVRDAAVEVCLRGLILPQCSDILPISKRKETVIPSWIRNVTLDGLSFLWSHWTRGEYSVQEVNLPSLAWEASSLTATKSNSIEDDVLHYFCRMISQRKMIRINNSRDLYRDVRCKSFQDNVWQNCYKWLCVQTLEEWDNPFSLICVFSLVSHLYSQKAWNK